MDTQAALVPQALETAVHQQRIEHPNDNEVLDRLVGYLKIARPTTTEIRDVVLEFYGIRPEEMQSSTRNSAVAFARHMASYFCRKYTRASLQLIASRVGYDDHSSVHYGMRKIALMAQSQAIIRDDIDLIKLRLCEVILRRPRKGISQC